MANSEDKKYKRMKPTDNPEISDRLRREVIRCFTHIKTKCFFSGGTPQVLVIFF